MAKFHYDLSGAEPIIRDVPVKAASTGINVGEFVQAGATQSTLNSEFISAQGLTSTCMVDGLGISMETNSTTSKADFGDIITTAATTTTAAISSCAATLAQGSRYAKCIINPLAVYLLEYDQGALSSWAPAATTASTTYTDTVAQYSEGSWLYCTLTGSTAANAGQLRYVTVSTSTNSWTLLSAITLTTSDKCIQIKGINQKKTDVNAVAANTPTLLSNLTANDIGTCVSLVVVSNYVGGKNKPMEPLRASVHNGITDTTLKFYSDIALLDHIYNGVTA